APGTLGDAFRQARTAGEQIRIHRPDGKVVQGEVVHDEDVRGEDTRGGGVRGENGAQESGGAR
ncbi:MAG TPA: hypothetical protein VFY14_10745, partial [Streptomyces sp.]|nr:hypothetical protein [Streptomyces sp.]